MRTRMMRGRSGGRMGSGETDLGGTYGESWLFSFLNMSGVLDLPDRSFVQAMLSLRCFLSRLVRDPCTSGCGFEKCRLIVPENNFQSHGCGVVLPPGIERGSEENSWVLCFGDSIPCVKICLSGLTGIKCESQSDRKVRRRQHGKRIRSRNKDSDVSQMKFSKFSRDEKKPLH